MRKLKMLLLVILLLSNNGYLSAQEKNNNNVDFIKPFSNIFTDIPIGYSMSCSGSYPLFEDTKAPLIGNIKLGLSSILNLMVTNEGNLANMLGNNRPSPAWGLQVQILPQFNQYPSVSLWVKSSIGWNNETLNQNDFVNKLPYLFDQGLFSIRYQYSSTSAGVATEMQPIKGLLVALNIGLLELRSQNLWIFLEDPFNENWYHDINESNSLMFDGAILLSFSPIDNIYVIGEIKTLPYFNADLNGEKLVVHRTTNNSLGLRYSLPIPLNIDAFLSSSSINGQSINQFRLGLSGLLNLNSNWE
ncbi:MAG: hypothetical protein OQJ93_09120 [Ignavibacteriaceae bacterium]|nr:hypothetical protein [Ignavibacteriaceae bacterium]MCW8813848.1 hypothetical protein [Chlorobium sp.]MCW8816565.1 hypothetical protein [Ignavibacteriaceae bacterium]MCW8823258.1 hypothetical protein [Ignavibacteriaceae bacterium]MCW8961161.1 hypothetical protein [Ignavibacteriaceae bacterium]